MNGISRLWKPASSSRLIITVSFHGGRTTGALTLSLSAISCGMKVLTSLGACSPSNRIQSKPAMPRISAVIGLLKLCQQPISSFFARMSRRNGLTGRAWYGVGFMTGARDGRRSARSVDLGFGSAGRRGRAFVRRGGRRGRLEEIEVAALVGLADVLQVQRAVAALELRGRARPRRRGDARSRPRRLSSSRRRFGTSSAIRSPLRTSASGPPTADSGATCSTQAP